MTFFAGTKREHVHCDDGDGAGLRMDQTYKGRAAGMARGCFATELALLGAVLTGSMPGQVVCAMVLSTTAGARIIW